MSQTIEFDGVQHEFPDDFSQADIAKALKRMGPQAGPMTQSGLDASFGAPPKPPQVPPGLRPEPMRAVVGPGGKVKQFPQSQISEHLLSSAEGVKAGLDRMKTEPFKGGVQALTSAARGAAPLALPGLARAWAAAPGITTAALGVGAGVGTGTKNAAEALGVDPVYAEGLGDVAGMAAGAGTAKAVPALSRGAAALGRIAQNIPPEDAIGMASPRMGHAMRAAQKVAAAANPAPARPTQPKGPQPYSAPPNWVGTTTAESTPTPAALQSAPMQPPARLPGVAGALPKPSAPATPPRTPQWQQAQPPASQPQVQSPAPQPPTPQPAPALPSGRVPGQPMPRPPVPRRLNIAGGNTQNPPPSPPLPGPSNRPPLPGRPLAGTVQWNPQVGEPPPPPTGPSFGASSGTTLAAPPSTPAQPLSEPPLSVSGVLGRPASVGWAPRPEKAPPPRFPEQMPTYPEAPSPAPPPPEALSAPVSAPPAVEPPTPKPRAPRVQRPRTTASSQPESPAMTAAREALSQPEPPGSPTAAVGATTRTEPLAPTTAPGRAAVQTSNRYSRTKGAEMDPAIDPYKVVPGDYVRLRSSPFAGHGERKYSSEKWEDFPLEVTEVGKTNITVQSLTHPEQPPVKIPKSKLNLAAGEGKPTQAEWQHFKTPTFKGEARWKRAQELGISAEEAEVMLAQEGLPLSWHPLGRNKAGQKWLEQRGYVKPKAKSEPKPKPSPDSESE